MADVFEMKLEIVVFLSETKCDVRFENKDWDCIEKLVPLLKMFHDTTQTMSDRYANASLIIPEIKTLKYLISQPTTKVLLSGLLTTIKHIESSM